MDAYTLPTEFDVIVVGTGMKFIKLLRILL